jgi:hypothetical protein
MTTDIVACIFNSFLHLSGRCADHAIRKGKDVWGQADGTYRRLTAGFDGGSLGCVNANTLKCGRARALSGFNSCMSAQAQTSHEADPRYTSSAERFHTAAFAIQSHSPGPLVNRRPRQTNHILAVSITLSNTSRSYRAASAKWVIRSARSMK